MVLPINTSEQQIQLEFMGKVAERCFCAQRSIFMFRGMTSSSSKGLQLCLKHKILLWPGESHTCVISLVPTSLTKVSSFGEGEGIRISISFLLLLSWGKPGLPWFAAGGRRMQEPNTTAAPVLLRVGREKGLEMDL